MEIGDFIRYSHQYIADNPTQRLGQAYMNALTIAWPGMPEKLTVMGHDIWEETQYTRAVGQWWKALAEIWYMSDMS